MAIDMESSRLEIILKKVRLPKAHWIQAPYRGKEVVVVCQYDPSTKKSDYLIDGQSLNSSERLWVDEFGEQVKPKAYVP